MGSPNAVRFRAMLDQADAVMSESLANAPNEMLAMTFLRFNELAQVGKADEVFALIQECGPVLRSRTVFALLRALADELCRREEMKVTH